MIGIKVKSEDLLAKFFRGFADPSRLTILNAIREEPLTVNDIVETTGLTQSNVSNHLACLRNCGHVIAQQTGRHVIYRISSKRVGKLLALAEEILAANAAGVYECTKMDR